MLSALSASGLIPALVNAAGGVAAAAAGAGAGGGGVVVAGEAVVVAEGSGSAVEAVVSVWEAAEEVEEVEEVESVAQSEEGSESEEAQAATCRADSAVLAWALESAWALAGRSAAAFVVLESMFPVPESMSRARG